MKFREFLGVGSTAQQAYFKDGVDLIYPSTDRPLRIAILPAYNPEAADPTGWLPAVDGEMENDFYCTVRAAKFVGHGNRRVKVSFLSPKTFSRDADDPYEAFYDYCSRSDRWSYLTKDRRGKRLTGEVEGAIFPNMRNFFVANVVDVGAGSRGGVFVTELSESAGRGILYSLRKNGTRVNGLAFARDNGGRLVYGDVTNPKSALVIEIAYGGKGYVARPVLDGKGGVMRMEIPSTLLQHRRHMEEPGSFLVRPESGQQIVDRLAGMLRGYKSGDGKDEIEALKEAMTFAYGDKYRVDDEIVEGASPFSGAARETAASGQESKVASVEAAVERGVEQEKYTPVNNAGKANNAQPDLGPAPGEDIDPSDIAAMRKMLAGG